MCKKIIEMFRKVFQGPLISDFDWDDACYLCQETNCQPSKCRELGIIK